MATPDVRVAEGSVPEALDEAAVAGLRFQAAPGRYLLRADGVARYLVTGGERVVIDREPRATDPAIWTVLLGSPLAALIHQRGGVPLVAAAVEDDERTATLIAGAAGPSPSALAAALARRGRRTLTTRVAVLAAGDDGAVVMPGEARSLLTDAECRRLDLEPAAFPRPVRGLPRRAVPLDPRRDLAPRLVRRLVLLEVAERPGGAHVELVDAGLALGPLLRSVYRPELSLGPAPAIQFRTLVSALAGSRTALVRQPMNDASPGKLADRLLKGGHA